MSDEEDMMPVIGPSPKEIDGRKALLDLSEILKVSFDDAAKLIREDSLLYHKWWELKSNYQEIRELEKKDEPETYHVKAWGESHSDFDIDLTEEEAEGVRKFAEKLNDQDEILRPTVSLSKDGEDIVDQPGGDVV